jgi:hypothetical protein
VPCQARGLSQDHNANTALIEIPDDAPHGLQLVCSHAECVNSKRSFKYCRGKIDLRHDYEREIDIIQLIETPNLNFSM